MNVRQFLKLIAPDLVKICDFHIPKDKIRDLAYRTAKFTYQRFSMAGSEDAFCYTSKLIINLSIYLKYYKHFLEYPNDDFFEKEDQ